MLTRRALAVLALVACRPTTELVSADGALRVAPTQLDFGAVARGSTATRSLTLQNASAAPLSVQTATGWPFDAQPQVQLGGGTAVELAVHFSPIAETDTPGALDLFWGAERLSIPLHGVGVGCPAVDTCHALSISNGVCTPVPAADGTPCASACLTGATCRAGACVGSPASCDDGDACTVDTCDPANGCGHVPRECPSTPCGRGVCDPHGGCSLAPKDDGTLCGESACAWADVCIEGTCERRPTPNADLECRYTDLAASENFTCAVTRGGHVRCWGGVDYLFGRDEPPAPPTTVSGWSDMVAIAADWSACGIDIHGTVRCTDPSKQPVLGMASPPASFDMGYGEYVAVSPTGTLSAWGFQGTLAPVTGPVKQAIVSGGGDIWVIDGQDHMLFLRSSWSEDLGPVPPPAHLSTFGGYLQSPVLTYGDGTVELGRAYCGSGGDWLCEGWGFTFDRDAGVARWDAGAVAVGGSDVLSGPSYGFQYLCAAQRGGVVVCRTYDGLERRYRVPGEVVKLTQHAMWHVCALTDRGDIWCWGENAVGQLGQTVPDAELHWLDAPVTSLSVGRTVSDGGLYQTDYTVTDYWVVPRLEDLDGGVEWSSWTLLGVVGDGDLVGGSPFVLDSAGRLLDASDGGLHPVATGIASCGGVGTMRCADGGVQWGCTDQTGQVVFVGASCPGEAQGCVRATDGGVSCGATPVRLPGPAVALSTFGAPPSGCAILPGGDVRCWNNPNATPQAIPGLAPGARQIEGSLASGCALVGPSAVQCWGDNSFGQLGRPGPASATATLKTFDEPVTRLTSSGSRALEAVCVQLQSGRAACWGSNQFARYAPLLLRSQLPLQIVK